ncbi:MAG TPA: tetratricopeptide repeat protein [Hyphomicrobiaceae bacterium]|nr:tetratricopeptide repeat protein [Hyphomicrobiaceae bacterium]
MTPSLALAMVAILAGVAGLVIVLVRLISGPSNQLSYALAQLGVVRLKELERSWRGRTDEARIELLRQLLEEARASRAWRLPLRSKPTLLAAASLIALALCGVTLLSLIEEPVPALRPAQAASFAPQDPDLARLELYAKAKSPRVVAAGPMSKPAELPDVDTMIERLAARLQTKPDDADGWRMLGWSYFNVQRPSKAVDAYARAVQLQPQVAAHKVALGEAMVAAENGIVTPSALEAFNAALAVETANAKARFFQALAMQQSGRKKEALDAWVALLTEPLGDEPWVGDLRQRTQDLGRELNVDVVNIAAPAQTAGSGDALGLTAAVKPSGKSGPGPRALTAQEMEAASALTPDQRQAMIRSMVEGLATRLQMKPRDEEGWLRLIHSRVALGEEGAAREALARALAEFADDASAGGRIAAAAKELGLSNN